MYIYTDSYVAYLETDTDLHACMQCSLIYGGLHLVSRGQTAYFSAGRYRPALK